jgi:hypothetical protein
MNYEDFERLFWSNNALFEQEKEEKEKELNFEKIGKALLGAAGFLQESTREIRETNRRIQKIVGDLERKFGVTGKVMDGAFVSGLERRFNVIGFFFQRLSERALFGNREYLSCYAEIDLFMENHNRAVAVAVKPRLSFEDVEQAANPIRLIEASIDDVREHLEQMEKLRRNFDLNNDRRKLYGAVAAAVFPENVLGFALEQGFYVIEYAGEHIELRNPNGGAKVW